MVRYQKENSKNSYEFRCVQKKCIITATHIHEYTEILYALRGDMTALVDGTEIVVPEGHMLFIMPNQPHRYTKRTECEIWYAVFSNDLISAFFDRHRGLIPISPVADMREHINIVRELQKAKAEDITRISGLLHLLFAALEDNTHFVTAGINEDTVYTAALGYVMNNYKSDITLASMAKALGYHEKYLSSALHSLTKTHFRTFVASYRISNAKHLLKNTDMPISQVAMESGFSAINTFNRFFKQFTGTTPGHYRSGKTAAKK